PQQAVELAGPAAASPGGREIIPIGGEEADLVRRAVPDDDTPIGEAHCAGDPAQLLGTALAADVEERSQRRTTLAGTFRPRRLGRAPVTRTERQDDGGDEARDA